MQGIFGCVVRNHDLRLVGLAVAICALACYTAVHMLSRTSVAGTRAGRIWTVAAAVAFGTGVWTTHFIAVLAFHSGLPVGFAAGQTVASLALVIGFSCVGFASLLLPPFSEAARIAVAGGFLAGGITGMHYVGMAAMLLPGRLRYEAGAVTASVGTCLLLGTAGLALCSRGKLLAAAGLLLLAICSLHFTGMAALRIDASALPPPEASLPTGVLAVAVAAAGVLVVALSLAGSVLDERLAGRAEQETQRLRQLADSTFEGLLFEMDGVISDINSALGTMIGRAPKEVVGRGLDAVFCTDTMERLRTAECDGLAVSVEGSLRCEDGSPQPVEILRRTIAGSGCQTVLAVRDLSERRSAEQRIQHLAHHDPLTGLANRLLLADRLAQAMAAAKRSGQGLALLCLDLDGFKTVNDLHGHPVGDRLLTEVAARIVETVRDTDTPARIGGDEFAIVQPMVGQPEAAAALADRLVAELGRHYEIDGQNLLIGTSIGVALFPQDGVTPERLTHHADLALYRAKRDGRGLYRFFEPEMDRQLRERRALEHELREALAAGDLSLHYQPLFEGDTLQLSGYEALMRWTHPVRGAIPPSEFIPLAEESGLICVLGRWALEEACAAAASWPDGLRVAVNLSPAQFRQTDLVGTVAATLRRHGLEPSRLELEITEGVLIDDAECALVILRRLKELGLRIALDDFGTGYSSLSYLRRFPFDKLKIDKSFVQALGDDPDADALVRSIIGMAHSLRLEVTAEGVETADQLARLQAERCSEVQGFLLGRPGAPNRHEAGQPIRRPALALLEPADL